MSTNDMRKGMNIEPDKMRSIIMDYQDMMGMNRTGNLDTETMMMMNMPRCGNPDHEDLIHLNNNKYKKKNKLWQKILKYRSKRYAFNGGRPWSGSTVTWKVSRYSQRPELEGTQVQ